MTAFLFLDNFNEIILQQTQIKRCHYYPERWQPNAPEIDQVDIPDSLKQAIPKRLVEFIAGRVLAKQLLLAQGCQQSVERGVSDNAPIWPAGFIGSISHSKGIAASALLPTTTTKALGLDVEHWLSSALARQIQDHICTAQELAHFDPRMRLNQKVTLIFSAKEALYKMLYPQVRQFFGFSEARLIHQQGDEQAGSLTIELLKDLSSEYLAQDSFVIHYKNDQNTCLTLAMIDQTENLG
ncbi:4'-phosphopantetheinyl transferase superfamily protein [Utexia brackfieldae]|uniref:4'-phosphopantetheinyl transferase family protein n=1 Tax=Utexia brackfieldae TaxID=3074108 RepID=UPI00370D7505